MKLARLRSAVVSSGLVLWAQLVLIPALAGSERVSLPLAALATVVAFAGLVGGLRRTGEQLNTAAVYLLAVFPLGVSVFSLASGVRPVARFDVLARVIASATAVFYAASCAAWMQESAPRAATEATPAEPRAGRTPAPPLHKVSLGMVGVLGFLLAVVFPALLAVRGPVGRVERLGGEGFAQARGALGTSAGLALGLVVVLSVGGELVRGKGPRRRGGSRGTAWLLWGLVVAVLVILLRKAR